MSLRIGVVTPRFHPTILGGAELHARWLAEHVGAAGHEVEVFTTCALDPATWRNALPEGESRHEGLVVRRYPVDPPDPETRGELDRRMRTGQRLTLEEEERWLRGGAVSAAMEEDLARRGPDLDAVIGLPYLAGTTYFAFRAVPDRFCLVPCLHDEPFARLGTTRRLLTLSRGLMFNTEPERALARSIVPDLAPSSVVGLGFERPAAGSVEGFRERYGVSGPFAVFVGRLEQDKNVPLLLRWFERYKERQGGELSLVMVGEGDVQPPERPDVIKLAIDWNDRDAMLKGATLLFQPSLNESLSIVMMQAWLCGLPVLVHAQGAVSRFHCERSNGGLWFENYPELEVMLDRLLAEPQLRRGLGANGRAYVEREYGWPRVLARLEGALAEWGVAPAA